MKPKQQLIAIIVLLIIVIGGFTLYSLLPLLSSNEVVLKTMQVDPFDPLRGQYLIIAYEASRVNSLPDVQVGDNVYVSLIEEDGIWNAAGAHKTKPQGTFIRGTVQDVFGEEMTVRFGIEQYFFERNAVFEADNLTVRARIASNGQARILELLNDGEPLVIEYQNSSVISR